MKKLYFLSLPIIALSLALSLGALNKASAAWEPVMSCQGGDLAIDQEWYQSRGQWFVRSQLVLRNRAAVEYFVRQGAFGDLSDKRRTAIFINEWGELIIPGGVDFTPGAGGRYPFVTATTWRFTEDEYRREGYGFILLNLTDEGYGNVRMSAIKANPYPSERPELANWFFHSCWRRN